MNGLIETCGLVWLVALNLRIELNVQVWLICAIAMIVMVGAIGVGVLDSFDRLEYLG